MENKDAQPAALNLDSFAAEMVGRFAPALQQMDAAAAALVARLLETVTAAD